jgi:hypothetical protein
MHEPGGRSQALSESSGVPGGTSRGSVERRGRGPGRGRLVIPVMLAGLLVAGVGVVMRLSTPRAITVSAATRQLHELMLRRPSGGRLGEWIVQAQGIDPISGQLRNVNIESDEMRLAARTGVLVVDPDTNSFNLHLTEVVFTRLPGRGAGGEEPELLSLPSHVLGPVPLGRKIVPDAGAPDRKAPLAGATPAPPPR